MAKKGKKANKLVCRFINKETGEHYTIRISRKAYDKLSSGNIIKYSAKLRKHVVFSITKNVA